MRALGLRPRRGLSQSFLDDPRVARAIVRAARLDPARLRALAPDVDVGLVERHLRTFEAICAGRPEGGPVAGLPRSDRFHWLTAPRSTIIQTSPVHVGWAEEPAAAVEELLAAFVRPPSAEC